MKTVLLFGTFDFLHSGHLHAFKEAKQLGETLMVSVASDAAVKSIKGQAPIHTQDERLALVRHIDVVDEAFIGDEALGVYTFFKQSIPDVIALGYDQQALQEDIEQFMKENQINAELALLSTYNDGKTKSSTIKTALDI